MSETKFIKGQKVKFNGNHHNYLAEITTEIVGILQYNPWGRLYIVDGGELVHHFPNHEGAFIVPEEYLETV